MGKRRVLAKAAKDSALDPEIPKRPGAVSRKLALRHAIPHRGPCGTIGNNRDVVGALHQSNLSRRFEHATTGSYGGGADKLELGSFLANAVVQEKAHPLFYPDAAGSNASVTNNLRESTIRTLDFFPAADGFAELDQFARPFFLELVTNRVH